MNQAHSGNEIKPQTVNLENHKQKLYSGVAVQQTLLVIRGNKYAPILLLTGGVHGDLVKF